MDLDQHKLGEEEAPQESWVDLRDNRSLQEAEACTTQAEATAEQATSTVDGSSNEQREGSGPGEQI